MKNKFDLIIVVLFLLFCSCHNRCLRLDDSIPDNFEMNNEIIDTFCIDNSIVIKHSIFILYNLERTCRKSKQK
jgi:hypothetical protein